MQHLEEGEIHAWLDGALSEAEGARIEQHAATCKECAAMVADARGLIAGAARIVSALDHVPRGVIPKSGAAATASRPLWRALRLTPFRAAMAASLVVAAGSLIVVQRKGSDLMVPRAEQIAMPMAASAPAIAVAPPAEDKAKRADAPVANEARQLEQPRSRSVEKSDSKTTLALRDTALLMKPAAPAPAPAPAPKVASVEDERAKKERVLALSSVVVTSATGNAAGAGATSAGRPPTDSGGASADIAFRRPLPPAVQRAAAADSARLANFTGCYEVSDSVRPPGLPARFALTADSAGARTQLLARRFSSVSSADSAPIGSWRRLTPASVVVGFTTIGFPGATYTLVRDATGITATSSQPGTPPVRIAQRDCPR